MERLHKKMGSEYACHLRRVMVYRNQKVYEYSQDFWIRIEILGFYDLRRCMQQIFIALNYPVVLVLLYIT